MPKSTDPLARNNNYQTTGSELVTKLREDCPELHNSQQSEPLACLAGTYTGMNPVTGQPCSTVLTKDRGVLFRMGDEQLRKFYLEADIFYHMDKTSSGKVWTMAVHGKNRAPLLMVWRRASFDLHVDSRYGSYLDITVKNTDPKYGSDLEATCRTPL